MSRFLDECVKFIETQPFEIIRISEIRNGKAPETAECTPANPCQNTYSVAKLFTMAAIGILYDRGLVRLDEKICDIFRDELPAGTDARWEISTVATALSHKLGLPGGFLDIDTHKSSEFTDDFLSYLFTYPLEYTPETDCKYSDGAFYLLARIAEKRCGMTLDDFLWKEALLKLDFQEMAWSHCPRGHVIGATGLYIHSADMAKMGAVFLNGGTYNGQRILSKEWVDIAVNNEYGVDWDDRHTMYYKGGMFGQKLIMVPGQNRVVALQAYGANSDTVAKFVRDYGDRD